jgi:hypothetical protein
MSASSIGSFCLTAIYMIFLEYSSLQAHELNCLPPSYHHHYHYINPSLAGLDVTLPVKVAQLYLDFMTANGVLRLGAAISVKMGLHSLQNTAI